MPRVARVVVPDCPHHVTQRGNRRTAIFKDEEDQEAYIAFLKKYTEKHELDVWAYCLMTNHVHFVVVPRSSASLSRTFRDAHTAYALRFNKQQFWGQTTKLGSLSEQYSQDRDPPDRLPQREEPPALYGPGSPTTKSRQSPSDLIP